MNVVITNHQMHTMGGTQRWVLTMYDECVRRGHKVVVLVQDGDSPFVPTQQRLSGSADIVLCNHWIPDGLEGRIVYTTHGPHPLEEPKLGAHAYVAVTSELARRWPVVGSVVYNPLGPEFSKTKLEGRRFAALTCSHYRGTAFVDPWRWLKESRVVEAVGRSALEAAACGCLVRIADRRPYGKFDFGWLTNHNFRALRDTGFTGRGLGPEWLSMNGEVIDDSLLREHQVSSVLDAYLEV